MAWDDYYWREYTTSKGKKRWYVTIKHPYRDAQGNIQTRRAELSTGESDKKRALKWTIKKEQELFDRAYNPDKYAYELEDPKLNELEDPNNPTFAYAALMYMELSGNKNKKYLGRLVSYFRTRKISEIDQAAMIECCNRLQPGHTPQTLNRHIYTPFIAVRNKVIDPAITALPKIVRPEGWDELPNITPGLLPTDEWFSQLMPFAPAPLVAYILVTTMHGPRPGETRQCKPHDLHSGDWTLTVRDGKTNKQKSFGLSEPCIAAFQPYNWRSEKYLFHWSSESGMRKALNKAVANANEAIEDLNLRYFPPNMLGRHSFATRLLKGGKSLKFVMDAGRWKTLKMPAERYGHLERLEVDREVGDFSKEWAEKLVRPKPVRIIKGGKQK